MNLSSTFTKSFTLIIALSIFTLPFLLGAEEGGTDSTQVASEVAPAAGYNNTRSNKSIVAAPDITNICDGVTCSDGSCAATADECVVSGTISPDIYSDSDHDNAEASRVELPDMPDETIEQAAPDGQMGAILATHSCPIHGYHLIIARPAGSSAGASERVIQVEKTNRFFNATWNEVENLISNYLPNELEYNQLPQNPGSDGERYCNRDGYMIPTDMNVYQVSLAHYNDYTGHTSTFSDNNLELAPLINVLHSYNQHRVFGGELPPTCNYGCLDSSGGALPDEQQWDDMNFGEINFGTSDPRNPANDLHDDIDPGVGGQGGGIADTAHLDYSEKQNYNESGWWPDADGDGWPEATLRAGAFIRLGSIEGEATNRSNIDITVVCWGRAEDAEGKVYAWGRGLCVAPDTVVDLDGATRDRIAAIQVRGDQVRNWSEEERSAWREYQETRATTSPEERLAERMIKATLVDERIKEMRADGEGVEVRYQTTLRLFGLIPIKREVAAWADIEGDLQIDYPWYRFMSTTPDRERINSLLLDTMDIVILVPKRAG